MDIVTPRQRAVLQAVASGAPLSVVSGSASMWWRAGELRVSGALVGRLARRGWISMPRAMVDGEAALTDRGAAPVAPRSRWSPRIAARMADRMAASAGEV